MKIIAPLALSLVLATSVFAADDHPERPDLSKAGQLFTVQVRPKAKKLEVDVAGNRVADAEMTKLGLVATLKVGNKDIALTPVKKGKATYVMDVPSDTGRLHLNVKAGSKQEDFEFEMPPRK